MQQRQHRQENIVQVTAEQKAKWTNHTAVYADIVIHKDKGDWASQQVVAAVLRHGKYPAGSRILDVASSAGRPAVPLAKVLPHVQFISTDLAPSSVHLALQHAKAAALANFTAQTADAQDLQDFSEATISAVTCSYGLQLMPDFPKALQEAYRVLQHGGLYVATLWGELEQCQMNQIVHELAEKLGGKGADSHVAPAGIQHASDLPGYLARAGFTQVTSTSYSHPRVFTMKDFETFLIGPCGRFASMLDKLEMSGKTDIYQYAQQMLENLCKHHQVLNNNTVTLENTAIMVTAVKA